MAHEKWELIAEIQASDMIGQPNYIRRNPVTERVHCSHMTWLVHHLTYPQVSDPEAERSPPKISS